MRYSRLLLVTFWVVCAGMYAHAQTDTLLVPGERPIVIEPDTSAVLTTLDSTLLLPGDTTRNRRFPFRFNPFEKKNGLPIPENALTLSLILPGAGQVYNRRWWKAPIIYAGLGALAYSIDYNTSFYIAYRDAYKRKLRNLPHRFSANADLDNAALLRSRRDRFDKNRQYSYFGFVALWIVQGAEAFVNAHLLDFDVSDDLSFRVEPHLLYATPTDANPGVRVVIQLP